MDAYIAVDDRSDHCTYARLVYYSPMKGNRYRLPVEELGPPNFTVSALQQVSK
jgi:hypothetical protein